MEHNRSGHNSPDPKKSPHAGQGAKQPGKGGLQEPVADAGAVAPARHSGPAGIPGYDGTSSSRPDRPGADKRVTRTGMIWAAVASALVVLVLLIIFILQNQALVQVKFFGLEGAVALGVSLFIAAVGGGVLVAIAGAARIIQLRAANHRRGTQVNRRR